VVWMTVTADLLPAISTAVADSMIAVEVVVTMTVAAAAMMTAEEAVATMIVVEVDMTTAVEGEAATEGTTVRGSALPLVVVTTVAMTGTVDLGETTTARGLLPEGLRGPTTGSTLEAPTGPTTEERELDLFVSKSSEKKSTVEDDVRGCSICSTGLIVLFSEGNAKSEPRLITSVSLR
jgi:hypothetical protein